MLDMLVVVLVDFTSESIGMFLRSTALFSTEVQCQLRYVNKQLLSKHCCNEGTPFLQMKTVVIM